jgi:hypothetical protein
MSVEEYVEALVASVSGGMGGGMRYDVGDTGARPRDRLVHTSQANRAPLPRSSHIIFL